jgi:cytochrome c
MRFPVVSAVAAALFFMGNTAHAEPDAATARALASKNACMGCHAVGMRVVGPSFSEVAARYQGKEAAQLAGSIRSGGKGKWGAMEMPAQPALSESDALVLAEWILAGSPQK